MNARTLFARKLVKTIRHVGEIEPSEARTERRVSRRDFLQTLALAGTGTLVGCAGFGGGKAPASAPKGTVAIVGAGSAGLTAAGCGTGLGLGDHPVGMLPCRGRFVASNDSETGNPVRSIAIPSPVGGERT